MKKVKRLTDEKEDKRLHRFSVDVDDETWEAIKIKAVKERKKIKDILLELIKEYVKRG